MTTSPAYFDKYSDKYMCCCGCMHVKTGVKVIIGLGVLGLIFSIIGIIGQSGSVGVSAAGIAIGVIAIGCLIAAVVTEKAVFTLPYLILQIISVLLYVVLLILIIVDSRKVDDSGAFVVGIIVSAFLIFFPLWFIFVVYGYYKFLKQKAELGTVAAHTYNSSA